MMRWVCLLLVVVILSTISLDAATSDFSKWQHRVSSTSNESILQNGTLAVRFPKLDGFFTEAQIYARTAEGARLMAIAKPFFRLSYLTSDGEEHSLDLAAGKVQKRFLEDGRLGLEFERVYTDKDDSQWKMTTLVTLGAKDPFAAAECSISSSKPGKLVVFRPLTILAGESSYGAAKDEALFPGLEYLLRGESSSSRLDITAKERRRFAPHPYKITIPLMSIHHDGYQIALLWDANQKWDGRVDNPSALFASPNFLQNGQNHLMAVYLPSFPWVEEYKTRATTPYPLEPGKELKLKFEILVRAGKHAIDAVDNWIRIHGLPAPPEKPRSWLEEAKLCLAPYITALWRENNDDFGWIPWTGMKPSVGAETCLLLMLGADVTNDLVLVKKLRNKASYAAEKAFKNGNNNLDYAFVFGPLESCLKMSKDTAENLMKNQKPDGSWVFDPPAGRTLLGVQLSSLGERGETAVGLTAEPAIYLLRYARITGDTKSAEAGLKALRFMNRFIRPQASQTWECPVHAPDILGAARAADAYLQGYLLTGDESLLIKAKYWARTGLPFIYLWNARDRSMMAYSTIAVYGASLYTWPWFGRPVQWNGLAYADVIRRLAPYDKSFDWRTLAKCITIAAMQQQASSGENKGLYPDSWYLVDDTAGGPWIHPAQYLLGNVLAVLGKEPSVRTHIIRTKTGRIHVSAAAELETELDSRGKLLRIRASGGVTSRPLALTVAGLEKPRALHWNGSRLLEGLGWKYSNGMLYITGPSSGSAKIQLTLSSVEPVLAHLSSSKGLEMRAEVAQSIAGQEFKLTVRAVNLFEKSISSLKVSPSLPEGWKGDVQPLAVKSLAPKESVTGSWSIKPPLSAGGERFWVSLTATYNVDGRAVKSTDGLAVKPSDPVSIEDAASDIVALDDYKIIKKTFRLRNASAQRSSGVLTLDLPNGWRMKSGSQTAFSIPVNGSVNVDLEIASPSDAEVGRYDASAIISLDGTKLPQVPIQIEIPVLCPKTGSEVRVDGDLSDWPEHLPIKISPGPHNNSGVGNDADLSAEAAVLWNDKYLYIACKTTDNIFLQEKEGQEIWRQDSMQIAFDTLQDRNTGGYEDDDYEYGFALTPSEILCWRYACPPDKLTGRTKIRLAIVRSNGKTIYEAAIPWSELEPFVPKPGRTMGVSILLNDDDGKGRKTLEWGGGIAAEKQPARFMGLRLVSGK